MPLASIDASVALFSSASSCSAHGVTSSVASLFSDASSATNSCFATADSTGALETESRISTEATLKSWASVLSIFSDSTFSSAACLASAGAVEGSLPNGTILMIFNSSGVSPAFCCAAAVVPPAFSEIIRVPHSPQNFIPGTSLAPQLLQCLGDAALCTCC